MLTNREKAIAALTEWLKTLDNDWLTRAIQGNSCIGICCKYCIYDDDGDCKTTTDTCQNGIRKWLQLDDTSKQY